MSRFRRWFVAFWLGLGGGGGPLAFAADAVHNVNVTGGMVTLQSSTITTNGTVTVAPASTATWITIPGSTAIWSVSGNGVFQVTPGTGTWFVTVGTSVYVVGNASVTLRDSAGLRVLSPGTDLTGDLLGNRGSLVLGYEDNSQIVLGLQIHRESAGGGGLGGLYIHVSTADAVGHVGHHAIWASIDPANRIVYVIGQSSALASQLGGWTVTPGTGTWSISAASNVPVFQTNVPSTMTVFSLFPSTITAYTLAPTTFTLVGQGSGLNVSATGQISVNNWISTITAFTAFPSTITAFTLAPTTVTLVGQGSSLNTYVSSGVVGIATSSNVVLIGNQVSTVNVVGLPIVSTVSVVNTPQISTVTIVGQGGGLNVSVTGQITVNNFPSTMTVYSLFPSTITVYNLAPTTFTLVGQGGGLNVSATGQVSVNNWVSTVSANIPHIVSVALTNSTGTVIVNGVTSSSTTANITMYQAAGTTLTAHVLTSPQTSTVTVVSLPIISTVSVINAVSTFTLVGTGGGIPVSATGTVTVNGFVGSTATISQGSTFNVNVSSALPTGTNSIGNVGVSSITGQAPFTVSASTVGAEPLSVRVIQQPASGSTTRIVGQDADVRVDLDVSTQTIPVTVTNWASTVTVQGLATVAVSSGIVGIATASNTVTVGSQTGTLQVTFSSGTASVGVNNFPSTTSVFAFNAAQPLSVALVNSTGSVALSDGTTSTVKASVLDVSTRPLTTTDRPVFVRDALGFPVIDTNYFVVKTSFTGIQAVPTTSSTSVILIASTIAKRHWLLSAQLASDDNPNRFQMWQTSAETNANTILYFHNGRLVTQGTVGGAIPWMWTPALPVAASTEVRCRFINDDGVATANMTLLLTYVEEK